MSHRVLQRVVVRMLYDPALVERVYADADAALEGLALDAAERHWLVQADRRAWGVDPYRRSRSLTGLAEEYPCSVALALRHHDVEALDRFFSAARFHDCIMERGSLAAAFGDFLALDLPPGRGGPRAKRQVSAVAHLEQAVAAVRRGHARAGAIGPDHLVMAPRVEALQLPGQALELHGAVLAQLEHKARGGPLLELVLRGDVTLRRLPELRPRQPTHLIVEMNAEGSVSIGGASPALVELLLAAREPIAREDLLARARELGADPGDDADIVGGLLRDGLLASA